MNSNRIGRLRLSLAFAAATCLLAFGVTVAYAEGGGMGKGPGESDVPTLIQELQDADDPLGMFASMSRSERREVQRGLAVASVRATVLEEVHGIPDGIQLAGGSGCPSVTVELVGENIFGLDLWKYWQRVDWCSSGDVITSVPFTHAWGSAQAPFWSYHGVFGTSLSGGVGYDYYEAWRQAKFKLCIGPWGLGCVQEATPWIDVTVYDGSSWEYSAGQS